MLKRWTPLLDLFVRPQIRDFVHLHALHMGAEELVTGARHAALQVNSAIGAAVNGDGALLENMAATGAVEHTLLQALTSELDTAEEFEQLQPSQGSVAELQLAELARQRRALEGEAQLASTLLVVGRTRRAFTPGLFQLQIGSHLVVIGDDPAGLWRTPRQRDLMYKHGCSVQVGVAFADPAHGGASVQRLTFEAAIEGDRLISGGGGARGGGEPDDGDVPELSLVDLNGIALGQGRFWSTATEV